MAKYSVLFAAFLLVASVSAEGEVVKSYHVVDFSGQAISLNAPAKRIVALAPHIVENLYSAGVGNLIVGATDYADYPDSAKAIPRIGVFGGLSIESVISLDPDLVIGWVSGPSSSSYEKLKAFGIPVYLDEPKQIRDIAKSIKDIGVLTGRSSAAERSANRFLSDLSDLRQRYQHSQKVDVLYQVWDKPLQTINRHSIISDVINLCGGRNIFADAAVIAPKISIESVIDRNPDVIVASGMGEERSDWLNQWLKWPSIKAVKNRHLFFVPPDLLQRHTIRLLEGARQLCQQLESVRDSQK